MQKSDCGSEPDPVQALFAAEAMLAEARRAGDCEREAAAHRRMGELALEQGQRQRARECFADAAVAYAMAGDEAGEQEMAARINAI